MVELKNTNEREIMSCMKELYYAIEEAFEVPNSLVPEEYHNNKTGYVSLSKLNKQCDKKEGISDHDKLKEERARRIEIYRKQQEENGEIEYVDIDEDKLYKNQIAWAKHCPGLATENIEKKWHRQLKSENSRRDDHKERHVFTFGPEGEPHHASSL